MQEEGAEPASGLLADHPVSDGPFVGQKRLSPEPSHSPDKGSPSQTKRARTETSPPAVDALSALCPAPASVLADAPPLEPAAQADHLMHPAEAEAPPPTAAAELLPGRGTPDEDGAASPETVVPSVLPAPLQPDSPAELPADVLVSETGVESASAAGLEAAAEAEVAEGDTATAGAGAEVAAEGEPALAEAAAETEVAEGNAAAAGAEAEAAAGGERAADGAEGADGAEPEKEKGACPGSAVNTSDSNSHEAEADAAAVDSHRPVGFGGVSDDRAAEGNDAAAEGGTEVETVGGLKPSLACGDPAIAASPPGAGPAEEEEAAAAC